MSVYLKKSKEKEAAAQKLINSGFWTSSIHCSYYSCLLLMKHILITIEKFDEKKIKQSIDLYNKDHDVSGTHAWIISFFNQIVFKNKNAEEWRTYGLIENIREQRNLADYTRNEFNLSDSKTIFDNSIEIKKILKKNYAI